MKKNISEIPDITTFEATIFDMDGVITQTAKVHARAWKQMFDEYLKKRSASEEKHYAPFDIETDYPEYIDGIPRYDGVENFLKSRGVSLAEGDPGDPPDRETICGLGNRKNELFREKLRDIGVEVYEDTLNKIKEWKAHGLGMAVISSSKNCKHVLETAKILHLFDVRVDGTISAKKDIEGKPAPDIFLEAARELSVEPDNCVVFEDAISGVKAGKAGGFGLTVGVARNIEEEELLKNGADIVISSFTELNS